VQELFGTAPAYTHTKGALPPIEWLQNKFHTKSAIIRFLYEEGHQPKTISKAYGFRYQHVRNVLTQELKRGPNEPFRLDNYETPQLKVPALAPLLKPRVRAPTTPEEAGLTPIAPRSQVTEEPVETEEPIEGDEWDDDEVYLRDE
jgi:hypothetical protein